MGSLLKEVSGDNLEKCVLCNKETPYTENTHIDYRTFYVEGCGQLCKECYNKVYTDNNNQQLLNE